MIRGDIIQRKKIMKIRLMAVFFAATTLAALPAQAQSSGTTMTTSVNARAGLAPVTTLRCLDDGINFGVWREPVRSTGGATTITLNYTSVGGTTVTVGGNSLNVGLAAGYNPPSVAACSLVGSLSREASVNTVVTTSPILLNVASNHESLATPQSMADLRASLITNASVTTDGNGDATIIVRGVLTIPETIVIDNFGGYKTKDKAAILTVG